jgi:hypothetical protein
MGKVKWKKITSYITDYNKIPMLRLGFILILILGIVAGISLYVNNGRIIGVWLSIIIVPGLIIHMVLIAKWILKKLKGGIK